MRKIYAVILALLLLVIGQHNSLASVTAETDSERREEFVYGVNAYNGTIYQGTFYPPSVDTVYILADRVSMISPRKTLIYYWAVTNEYKADFDSMNEDISGTLEIRSNGQLIASLQPREYVIQYREGITKGEAEIYLGGDAITAYADWQEALKEYRFAVSEYYQADRDWQTTLTERVNAGEITSEADVLVSRPVKPADFVYSSTKVFKGVPVNLKSGNYDIQLRNEQGQIVADSVKKLVVFNAERVGVGYTVIPDDKWTTPELTYNPGEFLYVRPNHTLYLEPFFESEYKEQYYTHLSAPQSPNIANTDWQWVKEENFKPRPDNPYSWSSRDGMADDVTFIGERRERPPGSYINDDGKKYNLQIIEKYQAEDQVAFEDYMVRQTPGKALGYEILGAVEGVSQGMRERAPDFSAFKVKVHLSLQDMIVSLRSEDEIFLGGSSRTLDIVRSASSNELFFALLLPLGVGVTLVGYRRQTLKRHRASLAVSDETS